MANHETPDRRDDLNPPAPADDEAAAVDDTPLPPGAWLARNGTYLFLILALFALLSFYFGVEGLWNITKVAIGLGFVIFFHELGHFVVAKWCDVHVQTFSIGFGPALPGCSFRRGETTYKVALVPLGGYVKMVGEAIEDGDDDDPRSFKNKTVWQRMAIISAGVVMNVILGCIGFIIAYGSGIKVPPAVVGAVEPGSPAWKKGVRSGSVIEKIGDNTQPYFDDLKFEVMLSRWGQKIPFVFKYPDGRLVETDLEPRLDKRFDANPVIGVAPPPELKLASERDGKRANLRPAEGPAAAARLLSLAPEDVIQATTDPDKPEQMKELPPAPRGERFDYAEFSRRLELLVGIPMAVRVKHGDDRTEEIHLPVEGFAYGNTIVGATNSDQDLKAGYDPFEVKGLLYKEAAHFPPDQNRRYDYFDFSRRLRRLAGRAMVIQVLRNGASFDSVPLTLFIPPAYHYDFGMRMKMGKVSALRERPEGQETSLKVGDTITKVSVLDAKGEKREWPGSDGPLDPVQLPYEIEQWAQEREKVQVILSVDRQPQPLPAIAWDKSWQYDLEDVLGLRAPVALPELGIAYQVEPVVVGVKPSSPAARADIRAGDTILAVQFKQKDKAKEPAWTGDWVKLWFEEKTNVQPWWAAVIDSYVQHLEIKEIQLQVSRDGTVLGTEKQGIILTAEPDRAWPRADRGLELIPDLAMRKAANPAQALTMGLHKTYQSIIQIYQGLLSLVTQRLSATESVQGPIRIAATAYEIAGSDFPTFVLFLAMISVNLAVVNFLPIPILDGGHMVFLIYEKLRGKPPSEQVRIAATYVGLAIIASLMLFAIYVDVKHTFFRS